MTMTKADLEKLDRMLVKLQKHLDAQHPPHPGFKRVADVRGIVDAQIVASTRKVLKRGA